MIEQTPYEVWTGLLAIAVYFTPWFIALYRKHKNSLAIMVVTLFLGWTVVGWVIALVWASTDNTRKKSA